MEAESGTRLGHYEIVATLGSGGMGVVYRAIDTRLDRTVAIKVLPSDKMADPERKRRFFLEAKAASSLNHPNIITVYDIGTAELHGQPVDYMVIEYVAGSALDRLISSKGLRLNDALKYAVQIADALSTAHTAGIIHRDIKPSNIMITEKGLVKVLDFGLAKLNEPQAVLEQTVTADQAPNTLEGTILGTLAYMSPEQAQGRTVDARSDVFSFGAVLYEMISGQRPFRGDSQLATVAAILHTEPRAVTELVPDISPDVERLIMRCLRKEPDRRVQHMDDLKVALEELMQDSVTGRLIPRPRAVSAARGMRQLRRYWWVAPVLLAVAGAVMMIQLAPWKGRPRSSHAVLTRLTSDSGLTAYPALSPDGRLVAHASDRGRESNLDIWVQQVGGGDPIRLTQGEEDESEPAFSPDGTQIAFRSERDGGGIYVVPTLGGEARLVARQGRRPRFSPDGNWIAYWVGRPGWVPGVTKTYVAPVGGGASREIAPEFAVSRYPVWMGDGKRLLVLGRQDAKGPTRETVDWWIVPLEGGAAVRTNALKRFREQKLTPPAGGDEIAPQEVAPDQDVVLFAATFGDTTNLWQVPVSDSTGKISGPAERITHGTELETQAAAGSGRRLVFSSLALNVDVWSLPMDLNQAKITGPMEQLTKSLSWDAYPLLSRDGSKLLFASSRQGRWAIVLRDLNSNRETTVATARSHFLQPKMSGDGNWVVYWEDRRDNYMIRTEGGIAEKICEDCAPATHVSFDGSKVLFESLRRPEVVNLIEWPSRKRSSAVVPDEHPEYILYAARFSPDERWISFHVSAEPRNPRIFIAPFKQGEPAGEREWIPVNDGTARERETYWSPDGNLLYFLSERDGFGCIWAQRLHPATKRPSGSPFPVQHFHAARRSLSRVTPGIAAISLCAAANRLVFALAELTRNLWMAEPAEAR